MSSFFAIYLPPNVGLGHEARLLRSQVCNNTSNFLSLAPSPYCTLACTRNSRNSRNILSPQKRIDKDRNYNHIRNNLKVNMANFYGTTPTSSVSFTTVTANLPWWPKLINVVRWWNRCQTVWTGIVDIVNIRIFHLFFSPPTGAALTGGISRPRLRSWLASQFQTFKACPHSAHPL
jgi:hypothetical protein